VGAGIFRDTGGWNDPVNVEQPTSDGTHFGAPLMWITRKASKRTVENLKKHGWRVIENAGDRLGS
jgi:hypothetical protein